MQYDAGYNLSAACVILVVICYYYMRQQIPVMQNKLFICIAWTALGSCVLDVVFGIMQLNPAAHNWYVIYLVTSVYFLLRNSLPIMFAMYVVSITDTFRSMPVWLKAMCGSIAGVEMVILAFNPLSHLVFQLDADGNYSRGGGLAVIYAAAAFFLLFSMGYTVWMRNRITRMRRGSIYAFAVLSIAASMIQMLVPELLVESLGISLCILMIYTNIQRPEEMMDAKSMLWNKNAFYVMMNQKLNGRNEVNLLLLEADNMDGYRSMFGIPFVDDIHIHMANYLRQFGKQFWIYAIKEGQFFLVQKRNSPAELLEVMEQMHYDFEHPRQIGTNELKLHIHIGMVECPEDASEVEQIFEYCEAMGYQKHENDAPIWYAKNLDLSVQRREKKVEGAIRKALEKSSFEVYYQPIYSNEQKKFVSAEALIRLRDEELGFISPEEFIPIAERKSMILEIGRFVLEEVCRFWSEAKLEWYGLEYIEVNLSVVQCMQVNLVEQLDQIMDSYQIPSNRINLEITETAAAYSEEMLEKNMERLDAKGIGLSMDDYGTGYSNMTYLLRFPFSFVKIDKAIVWAAFEKETAMVAMSSIVSMIKNLQMKIVAEGVETKEQAEKLRELGCDYLQGYYFSKPVSKEDFLKLMASQSNVMEV
ncbi:MAG: EAL domain-containing protein [Lachnospiraceae bacterium]|nr:EAL domain-containing protein [Lachnospiraceae bacterium]